MLRQQSVLVSLGFLVELWPWPSEPTKRPRGRPTTYAARLIMTTFVMMLIRRLETAYALLTLLTQAEPWPGQ